MIASRAGGVLVVLAVALCRAEFALGDEAGSITLSGRVLLADGTPAAGAIVERQAVNQERLFATRADADGRFQVPRGSNMAPISMFTRPMARSRRRIG